jgi:hypothetical protein
MFPKKMILSFLKIYCSKILRSNASNTSNLTQSPRSKMIAIVYVFLLVRILVVTLIICYGTAMVFQVVVRLEDDFISTWDPLLAFEDHGALKTFS